MSGQHRFAVLDSWRGIAAIMVVFYHFRAISHFQFSLLILESWRFVDFFFVLSGFIMAYSYGDRLGSKKGIFKFASRRFFRLWPLHCCILFALIFAEFARFSVTGHGFTGQTSTASILPNLLLIHTWGILPDVSWNAPSWSISAEVAAYLAFATIFSYFPKRAYTLCAIAGFFALILVVFFAPDGMRSDCNYAVARCLFGFMAGVITFRIWNRFSFESNHPNLWEVSTVLAAIFCISLTPEVRYEFYIVFVFSAVVFVFASGRGFISKFLMTEGFQFLGQRSYSIYMLCAPLWYATLIVAERSGWTRIRRSVPVLDTPPWLGDILSLGFVMLVVILADFAYRMIEEPARKFGEGLSAAR